MNLGLDSKQVNRILMIFNDDLQQILTFESYLQTLASYNIQSINVTFLLSLNYICGNLAKGILANSCRPF